MSEAESKGADPVIIELGKQKKSRIKRLRKGEGRLMDDVARAMEDLKDRGLITDGAQPVLIIVKEKNRRKRWPMF